MLRTPCVRSFSLLQKSLNNAKPAAAVGARFMSKEIKSEEFDKRYEYFFNRPDIDGWELRKGMNDICGMDIIPDGKILTAAMKACRRVNDFALAVRFLEAIKFKCGHKESEIYPYLIQEIRPTLTELGIDTPEELGYDKPELALQSVYDM